jgi:hypothetical protein
LSDDEREALEALRCWGNLMRQAEDAEARRVTAFERAMAARVLDHSAERPDHKTMPEALVAAGLESAQRAQGSIVERLARKLGGAL